MNLTTAISAKIQMNSLSTKNAKEQLQSVEKAIQEAIVNNDTYINMYEPVLPAVKQAIINAGWVITFDSHDRDGYLFQFKIPKDV